MKEEDIRPQNIFAEFLQLAREDTKTYFGNVEMVHGACPACETRGALAFVKHGFSYETCPNCHTLFVNPRPVSEAFSKFYTVSPSSQFWANTFYKETAEARREKLWKPKAQLIHDIIGKYSAQHHTVVDIGGGFGLFAIEFRNLCGKTPIIIEPGPKLAAVCRENSLPVIEKFLEDVTPADLPSKPKVFVSFELFEHLHDPSDFLRQLFRIMAQGDLFVFTTLAGSGVDIQVLWENSKSVMPPHHLNFLNPRSVDLLLTRLGFEMLSVSTPGKLDVDILVNNSEFIKDRFWKNFVDIATDAEKATWQEMIAVSGWSSHMMAVCRKP